MCVCVCDFSIYVYIERERERESRDMYRAHTRTCILYIFMCVCVLMCKGLTIIRIHTWKARPNTWMKLSATATSKALVGKDLPGGWGFQSHGGTSQISQIIQVRNDHERIERYWNLWWRLGIPHLRGHYYWIIFYLYSIQFYSMVFVGFSTRHDPVCHWESFAPTLVMACPLESWRASSCGMLWPLGPTRWLTAGPMAELNQRKN